MPVAQTQEIRHRLTGLGPESRALLELSTRRRVSDADLAQLLGVDTDEVRRRRQVAVEVLAVQLHLGTREELLELEAALQGDEAWQPQTNGKAGEREPNGQREAGPEPGTVALTTHEAEIPALATEESVAEEEPEAATDAPESEGADPEAESEHRRSRALTVTATGLLALVAGGAVLGLTSSAGDDGGGTAQTLTPPVPSGRLQPLPGAKGAGQVALVHGNLAMRVAGLPPARGGYYQGWLYNSIGDARSIGRLREGRLYAKLPSGSGRYRLVDVSREPRDGNPNHSGASVVRVPLSALRR